MAVDSPYVTSGFFRPFGANTLYRNDDGSSSALNITSIFEAGLTFGGTNYTTVYVNTNGNVTFGSSLSTYTPQSLASRSFPIIAPFWADVDTRVANDVGNVYWDFDTANDSFLVTWDRVGYYSYHVDKRNSFQLELKDRGGGNFDITYRYADINWTTGDASSGVGGLGGSVARFGYSLGSFVFEPSTSSSQADMLALDTNPGNAGVGLWTFSFRGGSATNVGTAEPNTFVGGDGDDQYFGYDGDDNLSGGGGNDFLDGGNGNDTMDGGAGDDVMFGGAGDDRMEGGDGDDTMSGGAGADHMNGGAGINTVNYGSEVGSTQGVSIDLFNGFTQDSFGTFDVLQFFYNVIGTYFDDDIRGQQGGTVANHLRGGAGNDLLVGWEGNDTLEGELGDDILIGWTDSDTALGGEGNDWLWLGDGSDRGDGGVGDDVLIGDLPGSSETGLDVLIGGLGNDILIGGAGSDTLYAGLEGTDLDQDAGSVNWLIGGAGDDLVYGSAGRDIIWEQLDPGENGNDIVYAGAGDDLILTGRGNDVIDAGAGNDVIYGGLGADTITTGAGNDLLWITGIGDIGDTITDFISGQDRMAIYPLLNAGSTAHAFTSGIFRLAASGDNTQLIFDADGPGGAAGVTVATFLARTPGSFNTAVDFI